MSIFLDLEKSFPMKFCMLNGERLTRTVAGTEAVQNWVPRAQVPALLGDVQDRRAALVGSGVCLASLIAYSAFQVSPLPPTVLHRACSPYSS